MLLHLINVITAHRPNKFARQLKKATKKLHDTVECHTFFKDLIGGELPDYKYALYLKNICPIYKAVEMFLFKNLNSDLVQSTKIYNDFYNYKKDLYNVIDLESESYDFYKQYLDIFLTKSNFLKQADLYVNWLADLYGGQILKNKVKYNERYTFYSVRKDIKFIRTFLEKDMNNENIESLIDSVNKAYIFHLELLNKIYDTSL